MLTISIYQKPYFSLSHALGGTNVASHNDVKLGEVDIPVDAVREHLSGENNTPTCEWYPLTTGGGSQNLGVNNSGKLAKQNNVWLLYLQMHMKYVLMSTVEQ